jgi:hypothetical protein
VVARQPEAERAPLVAERVLNRRSNYLADPLGQALVVGDDGAGSHRWPGLAVSRAVVGQAFLDDLEPHPVADVERYAEPLGDLGQFWCDDQLVGMASTRAMSAACSGARREA